MHATKRFPEAGLAQDLHRARPRVEGSNLPAITSSLVVFGAFDVAVSLAMYVWVYTLGVFPSLPALPRAPAFEWLQFASNW